MKTYFVTADIHGFYQQMMRALKKAGFDQKNPEHILIVCGDIFDRGPDSVKVYKFLKSLPKERRILILGNHELLLRDLIKRGYFCEHDYYNGTLGTVCQFTGAEYIDCVHDPETVCEQFKKKKVLDWIFSNEWQHYAEIGNYIFVHSWIPVNIVDGTNIYDCDASTQIKSRPDWREATDKEWEDATWGCPWLMAQKGLAPKGYTVVCGHWTAAEFPRYLDKNLTNYPNYNIYRGHGCIALDACTVRSGFCNVLVLTEDELKSSKENE